uniref:C6 domain-containing protein n=1 Tax=Haemonchus placei TaxID=6290 RepID=A0A0N4X1S7_HAEPC
LSNNAQGCRRMNAICRSGSPTDDSFMEFNLGIGGPNIAPTVTALLTCRADGKWYYTDGTASLAITDVSCSTTKAPATNCATCDPNDVVFKEGVDADETDAIREDLPNNAQGCRQMNAICESGSDTDTSFMEFNDVVGGPPIAPTVTARLVCRADQKWYYTEGGNSVAINKVTCSTTKVDPVETCATCDPSIVEFLTATSPDQTDAIMEELPNNAQGCKQMNAVCRSGTTDDSFMEFNGAIGGPDIAPTVTAVLTCRADQQWYFDDGVNALYVLEFQIAPQL